MVENEVIEVLCCCRPDNLLGYLPEGSRLALRETIDTDGNVGVAYSSEGLELGALAAMPGFVAGPKRKPKPKGKPARTWRETKKPTRTWRR